MIDFINYALSEIRKNYSDRWWWRQRLQDYLIGPTQSRLYGDDGIEVMDEDWDNLVLIDACRRDIFETEIGVDQFDEYRVVRSQGSATPEWIQENFTGKKFGDTVYVSANPWVSKFAKDSFHHVENIWMKKFDVSVETIVESDVIKDTGADNSRPVDAETLNIHAKRMAEEYPEKRLLVHYFQPHAPYIGNRDGSLKDPSEVDADFHPGKPLKDGKVDKGAVWEAYTYNLHYVWHHAQQLIEELDGKTVVTSDHGEMFGEWQKPFPIRGYDHPPNLRHPQLVNVPWAVVDRDRRTITDDGVSRTDVDEQVVNDRLTDLGYKV
ncbi:hypothetical protein V5735_09965 (plasmid) [Haladaptatus sp. SPP-AMP-3]|uniref:hypothetical protein n=1 Tax=Haladaptatus sp. SPP-AMP-3 TaxID=3121295 RepID=UPI003C2F4E03